MTMFRRAKKHDLASRLERAGTELSQSAAEKGADTSRRVSDILRRASDEISSTSIGDYRGRVMDAMDSAKSKVSDHADAVKVQVREHPFASVAVAAGMGMLMGAAVGLIGSRIVHEMRYE